MPNSIVEFGRKYCMELSIHKSKVMKKAKRDQRLTSDIGDRSQAIGGGDAHKILGRHLYQVRILKEIRASMAKAKDGIHEDAGSTENVPEAEKQTVEILCLPHRPVRIEDTDAAQSFEGCGCRQNDKQRVTTKIQARKDPIGHYYQKIN